MQRQHSMRRRNERFLSACDCPQLIYSSTIRDTFFIHIPIQLYLSSPSNSIFFALFRTDMAPPRKKAEKMDLSSFLGDASIFNSLIVGGGAWSDDIDLPTAPASSYDRPSAPTSNLSHQQSSHHQQSVSIDPSTVPNDPPFIAYVGNLAFDTSDQDLETFFKNAEVSGMGVLLILD